MTISTPAQPISVGNRARFRRWLRGAAGLVGRMRWGGRVALLVVALLALGAIFGPLVLPGSPLVGETADRLLPIGSSGHLLGTDGQGRDILTRLVWGARRSLLAGLIPVAIAGTAGTALGILAGLGTKRTHTIVMRTLDVFYAFPAVLLAIAISAALGAGISNAIVALSIVLVPPVARVAEGEVSRLRQADFMTAAETSGASRLSIAWRQVLPNIAPPVVVYCTAMIGLSIIYAAGLGFLGLGVSPPTPEWGLMVNDARQYIFTAPTVALVPAVAIIVAAGAFNVLGTGISDMLDSRSDRTA